MSWLNPYTWLLYGSLIAALLLGVWRLDVSRQAIGEARSDAAWIKATTKQKAEAVLLLDAERAKVSAIEQTLRNFKDNQEIRDAKNKTTVAGYERRLRAAAGSAGRLRDPNAEGCGGGGDSPKSPDTASAGHRATDAAEGARLLSKPLTELLFELIREADEINLAYASCRADTMSIRDASK